MHALVYDLVRKLLVWLLPLGQVNKKRNLPGRKI